MNKQRILQSCLMLALSFSIQHTVTQSAFALQAKPLDLGRSGETARVASSILIPYESPSAQRLEPAAADKTTRTVKSIPNVLFEKLDAKAVAQQLTLSGPETPPATPVETGDFVDRPTSPQIGERTAQLLPVKRKRSSTRDGKIVIHPPSTDPNSPNRHYFQIENTSAIAARNVLVELGVPDPIQIIEVMPYNTVVADQTAQFRFAEIAPGDVMNVEISTTPNLKQEVVFESRLAVENVRNLAASSTPHAMRDEQPVRSARLKARPASATRPVAQTASRHNEAGSSNSPVKKRKRTPLKEVEVFDPNELELENQEPMKIRSGEDERDDWRETSRMSYGPVTTPAQVMVANPWSQDQTDEPTDDVEIEHFTRSPNRVQLDPKSVDSDPIVPEVQQATNSHALLAKIDGPQHAVAGDEAEYVVSVKNPAATDAADVLVQLQVPSGLQITVLDRDAWFDAKAQTVTWQLPRLASGKTETIRYLAKINSTSGQLQKVTLGMRNTFQGQVSFKSTVMDQYELAAPLLPFEKDAKSLK